MLTNVYIAERLAQLHMQEALRSTEGERRIHNAQRDHIGWRKRLARIVQVPASGTAREG